MIPTMILFGLFVGRWWKSAIIVGAILWPTMVAFIGSIGPAEVVAAAVLGGLNTALGVAVHQTGRWLVGQARRGRSKTMGDLEDGVRDGGNTR